MITTEDKKLRIDKTIEMLDEFKIVSILRNLIKIPSYTGQESKKADYIVKEMERRGLEVIETYLDYDHGRRNIIGILRGNGTGKSLMLCAHHDTRWPAVGETGQHQARVEGDKIYGIGVEDSMSPTAVMFGVVDAIKRAKIQLKGDLIIMSSVDEMCFKDGARLLEENGIKADYCIMGESTDFDIGIVHTGKAEVEIRVTSKVASLYEIAAKAEHMGQKLTNPILAMHTIINYLLKMKKEDPFFQKTHPLLPGKGAAINIGTIIGGSAGDGDPTRRPGREQGQFGLAKRIPTYCYLRVGVRHWPGQTAKEFLEIIKKWVDKAAKENPSIETEVELYLDNGNDPFEISEDAEFVQIMKEVIRYSIKKEPKLVGTIFSTEGPYYQRAGMQFVYCSVPEHSIIGEYVTKEELMKLAKIWTAAAVYCVS